MADVERLLSEYINEHLRGGEANPLTYLDQLEGTDRAELAALIDEYLARSPGRAWDPEAFQGSSAELLTDRLTSAFAGEAGLWPVVMPRLRERARLVSSEIARRLAESLGVGPKSEKVGAYYHEMEQGLLDGEQVNRRVLDSLAEILNTSGDFLRSAGRSLGQAPPGGQASPAFTRRATRPDEVQAAEAERLPAGSPADDEWDEVDELFRGGPG